MPDNTPPSDKPHVPGQRPADRVAHGGDRPHDGCQQVLADLQVFIDAECEAGVERAIQRHLSECRPCLNRADFQVELKALIARKCSQAAPSGLIDRVVASLRAAGSGAEAAGPWGGA